MNLLDLGAADGGVRFGDATVPVDRIGGRGRTARLVLGVRPEDLEVGDRGLPVEVDVVEELGADAYVYGHAVLDGGPANVVARVRGRSLPERGAVLQVAPRPGSTTCSRSRTAPDWASTGSRTGGREGLESFNHQFRHRAPKL